VVGRLGTPVVSLPWCTVTAMSKSKVIKRSGGSTARVVITATDAVGVTDSVAAAKNIQVTISEAVGVADDTAVKRGVKASFVLTWWRGPGDPTWEVRVTGPDEEWLDLGIDSDRVDALLEVAESLLLPDL